MSEWLAGVENEVTFVMVTAAGVETPSLALTVEVRIAGGAFAPAAGVVAEISDGWYSYICDPAEAVVGPISIMVNAAGVVQQNLEYVCVQRTPSLTFWPYRVTLPDLVTPIPGVRVWVTLTAAGTSPILWVGYTDAAGWAKDDNGYDPLLPLGNNYFWKHLAGYTDLQNPDLEVVV
jgi:hypothetical protein